jgi:hypothetical protein
MKVEIEKKQRLRFIVLYELYKNVETSGPMDISKQCINFSILTEKLGIGSLDKIKIQLYLQREEYIFVGMDSNIVGITQTGFKIVEHVVTNPNQRTFNFPSFKEMGF